jgi:hypothetical protein
MSCAEIAPQFTASKGPFFLWLKRWIDSATNSLPVPLSPTMKTLTEVRATRSICVKMSRIACETPHMPPKLSVGRPGLSGA